ncbi:MAG: glycosyltransferase, partial [Gammaproteobacteria bacterium]
MTQAIRLSAIVPVTEGRYDNVAEVFEEYRDALAATGSSFEMVYVLDGELPMVREALRGLKDAGAPLTIVQMAKPYGEALAIMVGFEHASGELILTLPAFRQVEPRALGGLIAGLVDTDVVVARRWPRTDPAYNRLQARVFNWLLGWVSDLEVRDANCNVRVFKRRVLDEVQLYGNQHRFFALLAHQRGFKVKEIDTPQAQADTFRRVYSPGTYLGYLLDFLTVFFLVKFTK